MKNIFFYKRIYTDLPSITYKHKKLQQQHQDHIVIPYSQARHPTNTHCW